MQNSRIESRQETIGFDCGIHRRPYRSFGGSGWELCARREGRVIKSRHFSDVRYGTPGRARAAAIAYRERLLMIERTTNASANPSGSIYDGVKPVRKGGRVVAFTAETRLSSDQLLTKTYRTAQRGPGSALTHAVAERKRQLGQKGTDLLAANDSRGVSRADSAPNAHESDLKDIHRLPEDGCAPGWRVLLKKNHQRVSRIFLDREHGGKAGAFARALEFRGSQA